MLPESVLDSKHLKWPKMVKMAILVKMTFFRTKWTIWPEEVHFGPFGSAIAPLQGRPHVNGAEKTVLACRREFTKTDFLWGILLVFRALLGGSLHGASQIGAQVPYFLGKLGGKSALENRAFRA